MCISWSLPPRSSNGHLERVSIMTASSSSTSSAGSDLQSRNLILFGINEKTSLISQRGYRSMSANWNWIGTVTTEQFGIKSHTNTFHVDFKCFRLNFYCNSQFQQNNVVTQSSFPSIYRNIFLKIDYLKVYQLFKGQMLDGSFITPSYSQVFWLLIRWTSYREMFVSAQQEPTLCRRSSGEPTSDSNVFVVSAAVGVAGYRSSKNELLELRLPLKLFADENKVRKFRRSCLVLKTNHRSDPLLCVLMCSGSLCRTGL